jgi:RNA polymerase sigma-70 factor (ECF subfamily)
MSQKTNVQDLRVWYEKLEKPLLIYAYQIVHDREEAEDLVQEVFLRFSEQDDKIQNPRAWLYKTLRNLCITFLRKTNRIKRIPEVEQMDFLHRINNSEENNLLSNLERNEAIDRVKHSISLMPEDSLKIIQLKFTQHKTYQEIADETGLSTSNVGYKLHHIIKGLSHELKEEGFFNE